MKQEKKEYETLSRFYSASTVKLVLLLMKRRRQWQRTEHRYAVYPVVHVRFEFFRSQNEKKKKWNETLLSRLEMTHAKLENTANFEIIIRYRFDSM